ncbi:hypothetical protein ILUMI_13507 [Ignelater luminosus]|uniref:Reverse transcriptase domain-containing protein n=1 Tax=Ignelater luminosus TaxID=2038154 RepID=A0A8K0GAU7_IGNLU|nr:hypothetical protein ILUMI_13507 [Ignelater luminosus]
MNGPSEFDRSEKVRGTEAHGYLQIPLTEGAKEKTAFITPDETGQFERMIFGLTNAPYEFCQLMNTVLGPLKNKICVCYLDDLLLGARDWTEMLSKLELVLQAFEAAKFTLKLKKCMFGLPQVEYLGYVVSGKGIAPGKAKVEAIKKFPRPKNVHEVMRFLGMTAYFRRFTPNYAVKARPLSDLTKKTVMFQWNEVQEKAEEKVTEGSTKEEAIEREEQSEVRGTGSEKGQSETISESEVTENYNNTIKPKSGRRVKKPRYLDDYETGLD